MKQFLIFLLLSCLFVTPALAGQCIEDHFCFNQKAQQQPKVKVMDAIKDATGGADFLQAHPQFTHHDISRACKAGTLIGYICKGYKE